MVHINSLEVSQHDIKEHHAELKSFHSYMPTVQNKGFCTYNIHGSTHLPECEDLGPMGQFYVHIWRFQLINYQELQWYTKHSITNCRKVKTSFYTIYFILTELIIIILIIYINYSYSQV